MKKIIITTIQILLVPVSCEKEKEGNPKPKQLSAIDGFAVGCIHIDFDKDPNVNSVIVERREKDGGEWQIIVGTELTSFDDNHGYPQIGMPPGKVFDYPIKNDWPEDAEYSEIDEGYAYDIIPVTEIEISSTVRWDNTTANTLIWNEENNGTFLNQSEIYFDIYRSGDSLGTYQKVGQVGEDRSFTDELAASMLGKKVFYRIDVYYSFALNLPSGGYHSESTTPVQGEIVGLSSVGDNPSVSYISTDLGQIAASTKGGITQLSEKNVNGTLYLGIINEAGATRYGAPQLFSFNGTNWQNEWTIDPPNEFDGITYGISTDSHYLAGIDDSLCVYEWAGSSWGNNMAPDNLGQADSPSAVAIEVFNDNLYMAIKQHPDYNLQVLKYNGSTWDKIGGDGNGVIASGNIYNVNLEVIGSQLYLHYLIDNVLYIQHLNGSSWTTDLSWTKDNIGNIDIAKGSNDLYFIAGTTNSSYLGGLYKITSSTSAEEVISNSTEDWFQFPLSLTIDSGENLIVASMKYNESTTSFYPFLNLYDGADWETISGDFSDGMDPASISAMGTDIIYVYGDAASENSLGDPTKLKSKKMSKQ